MSLRLTCPYCRFSKDVIEEQIPTGAKWVTCPSCGQRFEFSKAEGIGFGFEGGGPEKTGEIHEGMKGTKRKRRRSAPWERRSELGFWKGIYQTTKAVLISPEKMFHGLTLKGGYGEATAFGLLVGSLGSMFGLFWLFLLMVGSGSVSDIPVSGQYTLGMIFLGVIAVTPVLVCIGIVINGALLHILLLLVGGAKNGFEATFRVVCYSQAAHLLSIIPIMGGWIDGIWKLVVQIIGVREIHEMSYGKVIIAFLIPFFLLIFGIVAIVILAFSSLSGSASF
jgi:predicted Zn finger-like uncharacterized protein